MYLIFKSEKNKIKYDGRYNGSKYSDPFLVIFMILY